jgi:hypothetical protein
MVADLEYWGQTSPVEVFLEKLAKQYSVNAVSQTRLLLENGTEGVCASLATFT